MCVFCLLFHTYVDDSGRLLGVGRSVVGDEKGNVRWEGGRRQITLFLYIFNIILCTRTVRKDKLYIYVYE